MPSSGLRSAAQKPSYLWQSVSHRDLYMQETISEPLTPVCCPHTRPILTKLEWDHRGIVPFVLKKNHQNRSSSLRTIAGQNMKKHKYKSNCITSSCFYVAMTTALTIFFFQYLTKKNKVTMFPSRCLQ